MVVSTVHFGRNKLDFVFRYLSKFFRIFTSVKLTRIWNQSRFCSLLIHFSMLFTLTFEIITSSTQFNKYKPREIRSFWNRKGVRRKESGVRTLSGWHIVLMNSGTVSMSKGIARWTGSKSSIEVTNRKCSTRVHLSSWKSDDFVNARTFDVYHSNCAASSSELLPGITEGYLPMGGYYRSFRNKVCFFGRQIYVIENLRQSGLL